MKHNDDVYIWQLVVDANEANAIDQVRLELKAVTKLLNENQQCQSILNMAVVTIEQKKSLINEIFIGEISALVINFLLMLIEENLFQHLQKMVDLYEKTVNRYLEEIAGIIDGEIYSAIALTELQLSQLTTTFSRKVGKQVRFSVIIDETLIGGYKVKCGNHIYDHSIKAHLKQLKQSLRDEHDKKSEVI